MRAWLMGMLLAGCYAPTAPGGAYLCGEESACPDNLTCTCGLCVSSPEQAACGFAITTKNPGSSGTDEDFTVTEHEPFTITVQALQANGQPATSFSGSASLSATWGDVCVGASGCVGQPNQVQLAGGTATTKISLNRETISPQSVQLRATFAGNVGTSGTRRISVSAPVFGDEQTIAPTLKLGDKYGVAEGFVGAPSVVKVSDGWRMYFLSTARSGTKTSEIIGAATATDANGIAFSPPAAPLYTFDAAGYGPVSALAIGDAVTLTFGQGPHNVMESSSTSPAVSFAYDAIDDLLATTSGSIGQAPASLLAASSCPFCVAYDTPSMIVDPNPALSGGGPNAKILFFSSLPNGTDVDTITVGRATSTDGKTFVVDPSPLLKSTAEESVVYSPHVLVDGSVYKMWYSVSGRPSTNDSTLLSPCKVDGFVSAFASVAKQQQYVYTVGYATSSDGEYWVRSPSNIVAPAFVHLDGALPQSVLVSSVVPSDGVDPSKGIALYLSPFSVVGTSCLPNGALRVDRD